MEDNELTAYAAAIADGEGSFYIKKVKTGHGTYSYSGHLGMTMMSKEPIKTIAIHLGVRYRLMYDKNTDSYMYELYISPNNIERVLLKMEPYLLLKKEQSKLVREFTKFKQGRIRTTYKNPKHKEYMDKCEWFYQRMRKLRHYKYIKSHL